MARRVGIVCVVVALALGVARPAYGRESVTLIWPKPDATVSGLMMVAANATGTAVSVRFTDAGRVLGVDEQPPFAIAWDTTAVAPGPHKLRAEATYPDGSRVASRRVRVTVDQSQSSEAPVELPSMQEPPAPAPPPEGALLAPHGEVGLPGRGLSIAWSPDGDALAAGGHFRDAFTRQRYDTRTIDVDEMRLEKSFDCHYFWTVAHAWSENPYLGEVIADGGGDHAVKIWNADGTGSPTCKSPGQFNASEGGIKQLSNINGWVMALAFSPDGKYLAGASRDRTVRLWQIEPGPDQFKVVRLWYDKSAGNFLSLRWSPDGRRLVTGDRQGHVTEWSFDPAIDRWDAATISAFAKLGWSGHPTWIASHPDLVVRASLWNEGGHKYVWNVRYSPDGNAIAAVGTDGLLSVYEARTGRVLYRTHAPKPSALHGLDWSPDGTLIAVGAADKKIYVFNALSGALADSLSGHETLVTQVAWSPDGDMLASTAGGPVLSQALHETVDGPDNFVHLWTRR